MGKQGLLSNDSNRDPSHIYINIVKFHHLIPLQVTSTPLHNKTTPSCGQRIKSQRQRASSGSVYHPFFIGNPQKALRSLKIISLSRSLALILLSQTTLFVCFRIFILFVAVKAATTGTAISYFVFEKIAPKSVFSRKICPVSIVFCEFDQLK